MAHSGDTPFNRLAVRYDGWFDNEGRPIFQSELAAIKTLINDLPRPWLEIGVGSGRFAAALGVDVGIDPADKLLVMARQRGLRVLQGRGEKLPFADSSFGTAFMIVTICFVDDPLPILQECYRVLQPSGGLVLGFVPRDSTWGKRYVYKGERGHPFYSHAKFYTVSEVETMLRATGFEPERSSSTLMQLPDGVIKPEEPRVGYEPAAGFVALVARRK